MRALGASEDEFKNHLGEAQCLVAAEVQNPPISQTLGGTFEPSGCWGCFYWDNTVNRTFRQKLEIEKVNQ